MTIALVLAAAGALVVVLVLLWLFWLGPGARRNRQLARIRRLLGAGQWREALASVNSWQKRQLSPRWRKKIHEVLAVCHREAGKQFLAEREYEKALESWLKVAELRGEGPAEARGRVVQAMLEEVRRLFAAPSDAGTGPVQELISRTLLIDANCTEATFWQALCLLRDNNAAIALDTLKRLADGNNGQVPPNERFIDPPLYLGAMLLRQGQPREALRYLTEANRIDSNCPVVVCLLGMAMIAAGGDVQLALRALQRPLGPRGFVLWADAPYKVWVEGFPEARSYVRRLASRYPYVCPLFGRDYTLLQRQGTLALAEGHYRLGQFDQAVVLYDKLVQESAPSAAVLRGLGLSLVRLGRFDQAFKHLRAAHELEQPKNHLTAGYLALCGARGKPASPEDKVSNVTWAVWLVRDFTVPGDAEWVGLLNDIFAEARGCGMTLEASDQRHLCDHLLSVNAADALAADAYHHLAHTHPEALRPEFAWLYCRASQLHHHEGPATLDLFARTFADRDAARQFYAERGWDFDDLLYIFLDRAATQEPGRFPEVLGADFAPEGEKLLLDRAERLRQAGDRATAVQVLDVLVRLAPHHVAALDRLAELQYQAGNPAAAIELLQKWFALEPQTALPLARLAILHQQQFDYTAATACVRRAIGLTEGSTKAALAFLGARLVLARAMFDVPAAGGATDGTPDTFLGECLDFLKQCLAADPGHAEAGWCLTAIHCDLGDLDALRAQAASMDRPDVADPRYHYMAAVGQLVAGNHAGVETACGRASTEPRLRPECEYLLGWDALDRQAVEEAATHFERVATSASPSAAPARALLGGIRYFQGDYAQTVTRWRSLEQEARDRWGLQQPLAAIVFLSALQAFQQEDYHTAAVRIREAGRLGIKDRRLGPLLTLALIKAGQKLLYQST